MKFYKYFVGFSSFIGLFGGLITIYMFVSGVNNLNGLIRESKIDNYIDYFKGTSFPEFIYSFFRAYISVIVIFITVIATIITGIIDLVLLIFGMNFPLTHWIWDWTWNDVVISWYWNYSTIGNRTWSIIILTITGIFGMIDEKLEEKKEKRINSE